jgi:ketosteroid isomerase-like protein
MSALHHPWILSALLLALGSACVTSAPRSKTPTPSDAVLSFVAAINRHDVTALGTLMSPDHVFVDSLGQRFAGRETMIVGWQGYFRMVPDYRIRIERLVADGETVLLYGEAGGTYAGPGTPADNRWSTPAAWRAVVHEGSLREWQVYADNKRMYELQARQGG